MLSYSFKINYAAIICIILIYLIYMKMYQEYITKLNHSMTTLVEDPDQPPSILM